MKSRTRAIDFRPRKTACGRGTQLAGRRRRLDFQEEKQEGLRDLARAGLTWAGGSVAGRQGAGEGSWLVRLVLHNIGWLPTSMSEKAVERKAVRPLEAEITLPEGARLHGVAASRSRCQHRA